MLLTYKNEKGEENSINTKLIKTARVKGDELYLKLIDDECVVIKRKFNVYFDVLVGKVIHGYTPPKVVMEFEQMTDDEILQLEKLTISARIMEISEEGNFVKNGKIYHPNSYEVREIVEQLDKDRLFYLSHRSFALIGVKMKGNKVEFGIDKEYL